MYYHDLDKFEDWDEQVLALKENLGQLSPKIERAIKIVKKYHDQPRMFSEGNYNRHPLRVARILAEELSITDETSVLIALCHDLGEWSNYDIDNLRNEFGNIVYEGVRTLTWNQKGEWVDFVNTIVNSKNDDLIAIKIADKLDNNRATALSGNHEEKIKANNKTVTVMLPLVKKYYPKMLNAYTEVLSRLE